MIKKTKIIYMPLDELINYDKNINVLTTRGLAALEQSILEHGVLEPLIISSHKNKNKKYVILDGNHRYAVCYKLKIKTLPCVFIDSNDYQALNIHFNLVKGQTNTDKLIGRMTYMLKHKEHTIEEIAKMFHLNPWYVLALIDTSKF